ncbi:early nodulin-like protein 2 [Glycine soja]|uniref:Early nodulin-like protein 2 n=1 Tax=Glycine soja TaxID=3848 RepID=A0A445KDK1_GLYSO|nr:early nodulin-like protein 2 [Glycine soja]RZC08951.1 Early nodulin-like protein 2 [Glycine soja]
MEFQKPLWLFLLLLTLLSSSQANKFNVGGSKGWVPNPSESYNNWAGRNRFQINDTIVFKYNKGSDSVLEVKKEDYDKCNKTNPIKKFENGDTEFKFDRSGPFYFISGKDGNCEKGQKLIVVVLTPRTPPTPKTPPFPKTSPSPSPSQSPKANPPTVSPPLPSPSPSVQPPSTSPSPASSPVPAVGHPAVSPSPESFTPAISPVNSTPTPAPETGTPPPSLGPSSSSPPSPGPSSSSPPSPGPSSSSPPPAGPTSPPSLAPSSNSTAPSPKNSGFSVAPSSVLMYCVTIVAGAALLRY